MSLEGNELEGEDGEDELLPARLWMGTYNPREEEGWLTLIVIGADIFSW